MPLRKPAFFLNRQRLSKEVQDSQAQGVAFLLKLGELGAGGVERAGEVLLRGEVGVVEGFFEVTTLGDVSTETGL